MQVQTNLVIKVIFKEQNDIEFYYDLYIEDYFENKFMYFTTVNDWQLSLMLPVEIRQYLRNHKTAHALINCMPSYTVSNFQTENKENNNDN